jgi:hypothetical protein
MILTYWMSVYILYILVARDKRRKFNFWIILGCFVARDKRKTVILGSF